MFCSECGAKNSDEFKFCSSCGTKRNIENEETKPTAEEKVEFVIRPKGVVLALEDDKLDFDLCDIYKEMIGAKYFDDIVFDAIFTTKRVLIRPVSKAPADMWIVGALISPGLAETADLMSRRISSFLTTPTEGLIGKSVDFDVILSLPFWGIDKVVEVKQSLPSLWNNAGTIIVFDDKVSFKSTEHKTRLNLVFDGSATTSKKQFNEFSSVAKLCKIDTAKIRKI